MKPKIFFANAVWLPNVPDAHRGNNGNCQFPVLVKTTTKKRVAALLNSTVRHLNDYGSLHVVEAHHVLGFCKPHSTPGDIAKQEDVVYYKPEHTKTGYINQWFEYQPRKTT